VQVEKINRYKKTMRLKFCNDVTEQSYQKFQTTRGRSTGIYSLLALAVINLTFAFLEFWILGINSNLPLYGFLSGAFISLAIVFFNTVSSSTQALKLRILIPGLLTLIVLLASVYLEQYRLYHIVEIALLALWLGSLNILSMRFAAALNLLVIAVFAVVSYLSGADGIKLSGLVALMVAVYILALYLSYMMERFRRMMFLTNTSLQDVFSRQENWAYTLIDLDMALSGIIDFKELIERMMEYLRSVIEYDSFVLTALDGKGPKPTPDRVEGALFEQEDETLWPEDLLSKLSQTRQATTSAKYDVVKGWFGHERKVFLHYRLDIPVLKDSTLMGVVSLRRESMPFDDLDMTAGVSLASQAMMIFDRSKKATMMSSGLQQAAATLSPASTAEKPDMAKQSAQTITSPTYTDIEVTRDPTQISEPRKGSVGRDETVVPSAVVKKIKQDTATARKTITLLSRENADHVAIDRYRTAAVEGEPLSLLLVEVDGLSSIREKEGDPVAYKVFAGVVKYVFSQTDKDTDVLGRYGQNGFSILLPRVDMNAAEKFAESLREHIEGSSFKTPYGERKATLSVGVAAITDETGNYDSMVKRADMALFVAKKNGRNCVKVRL
jgi:diguanylate cyclase (GGDEF)-like protein